VRKNIRLKVRFTETCMTSKLKRRCPNIAFFTFDYAINAVTKIIES